MTTQDAFAAALSQLRGEGFLTDADLEDLCGGDEKLARKLRQRLLNQRFAKEDETGVDLVFLSPAGSPAEAEVAGPEPEPAEHTSPTAGEERDEPVPPRHVFLSYGRRDAEALALRLKAALEADGHTVWLDRSEIKAGRAWEEQIEQALERADIVVAVLTPHAVRRPEGVCLDEISFARYHSLTIIPVMALICTPPLGIYRLDWVDIQKWEQEQGVFESGLRKLRAALQLGANQPVEGEYADLFGRLSPLDFGPDLARLQRDFTGREWLEEEVRTWLAEPDGPRVFLLTGDPGAGKSAAMAYLARKLPNVAALHLCRAADRQTLDPSRFVRSLAAQLAAQIPTYANALRGVLHDPDALNVEAGSLFKNLVVNPLAAAVPDAEQTPVLVLVDGLDEALQGPADPAIPALLGSFLGEFAAYGDRVRFVLSTRELPGVLRHFGSQYRRFRIEAAAAENRADLRAFLERMLTERTVGERLEKAKIDTETVARCLEEKAAGNFLYAEQAVLGIREGVFDPSDPAAFPSGLVGLYQHFFARIFPDLSTYETRMRPLLDVLVAAREALSAAEIAEALEAGGRLDAAGLDPLDPALGVRQRMKTLAALFPEREGRYAPYHTSVAEWLSGEVEDEADALEYTVSLKTGHILVAWAGLKAWQSEGAALPPYHLLHLPTHLLAAEQWDELYGLLTTLAYLEAKAGAGLVVDLARDFQSAHAAYPATRPERFILRVLGRALDYEIAFLLRHPECVFQVLWNRGWWYDAPQAAHFFEVQDEGSKYTSPWARSGPKVHALLERWRAERERIADRPKWVRKLIPPADLYAVPQRVLRGERNVQFLAWSPAGDYLGSVSSDGSVRVWRADGVGEPLVLGDHEGGAVEIAWAPSGSHLITVSSPGRIRLWDVEQRGPPAELPACGLANTRVAWSRLEELWAAAPYRNTVRVWRPLANDEPLILRGGHDRPVHDLMWSPNADALISLSGASGKFTVCIWRALDRSDPLLRQIQLTEVVVGEASRNGDRLAIASWFDPLRIWDASGDEEPVVLQGQGQVAALAWSPDATRLASVSFDGTLCVWQVDQGGEPRVLGNHATADYLAWSPEGARIATASVSGEVCVWRASNPAQPVALCTHEGRVFHIAWAPGGERLASASADNAVHVWFLDDPGEPVLFDGHTHPVTSVAWAPGGQHLASASYDRTVRVWPTHGESGPLILSDHAHAVQDVTWSPDGERLASVSYDRTVRITTISGEVETLVLSGHQASVVRVAWSPSGRLLASASWDGTVRLWDPESGGNPVRILEHPGGASDVVWSSAGDLLASAGCDGTVRVWRFEGRGRPLVLGSTQQYDTRSAWSPPGHLFASVLRRSYIAVWRRYETGPPLVLQGGDGEIACLGWSPDARHLASGSDDGTVRVWLVSQAADPLVLHGHKGSVAAVGWSPEGRYLASASSDGMVRVWEGAGEGEPRVLHNPVERVHRISWSGDGALLAAESATNEIHLWNASTWEALAVLRRGSRGSPWSWRRVPAVSFPAPPEVEPGPHACVVVGSEFRVGRTADGDGQAWFEASSYTTTLAHPSARPIWAAVSWSNLLLFKLEDREVSRNARGSGQ